MDQQSLNKIQQEAFEHLFKGRARMALPLAEQLIKERANDSEAAVCYAWALLENNDPVNAEKYMKLSADLPGSSMTAKMYRAYLQMRLSSFEGAVYDFNMTEGKQKELLAWTYLNKAKSLAAIGDIEKATDFYSLAVMIDNNTNPEWKKLKILFQKAKELKKKSSLDPAEAKEFIELCSSSLRQKEYWFSIIASRKLVSSKSVLLSFPEVEILELEAMYRLNQLKPVMEKIPVLKKKFPGSEKIKSIEQAIQEINKKKDEAIAGKETEVEAKSSKSRSVFYPSDFADVFSIRLFDCRKDEKEKVFYSAININEIKEIGIEIIFNNPFYQKKDQSINCFLAWYVDDDLVDQMNFDLKVPEAWDKVLFTKSTNTSNNRFWNYGNARVELFINKAKAAEKLFSISSKSEVEVETKTVDKKEARKLEGTEEAGVQQIMDELNSVIGLSSIKKSVRELIDYLDFMRERKQLGLKSKDQVAVHSIFLGNPGTGKTTVARLMGKIFKGMGLLQKGEVIEVDRSALVGQYVGETAQKTEKIIEQAIGNVLFIDEAYTLVKKGASTDFGQEAIDIILKRMEDKKGEFFVIAAGYPKEMEDFLNANPGLRSRFTHTLVFEDYLPEELIEIFKKLVKDEDYRITDDAEKILLKELTNLYRLRDKNFGNARTVRKIFDDAKIEISKRYLTLPKHEKTQEKLTTIYPEDIKAVLRTHEIKKEAKLPINDDLLNEALGQLEDMQGLSAVKKDVKEMVKLAKYYNEIGENIKDMFSSHIIFSGNPGTGKTTVARIISKVFAALAILPNGQLIEADRSNLVANYVGQTAEKTTAAINSAIGGTLFIDEAYSLVKGGENDFGKEAIDTLLKRMEDDRGKFIAIAAGYTDEMKTFVESNPGMKSRFTKNFFFEDFSPEELLEIFISCCKKDNLRLDEKSKSILAKYFNSVYRNRDKNFGNARIVRSVFEAANKKRILRLADIPAAQMNEEIKTLFTADDFEDIQQSAAAKKISVQGDPDKLESYLCELDKLTGLDSVKEGITKLVASLRIARMRKEKGLEIMQKPLHSIFTGNPGTGKTTVARIIAGIYKELGIVERGYLIEVDRAQMVAGYSGQTAIKTDEIIKKALGGILFIDEAYSLARGGGDFGQEAIDTLLKRMEDYKDQLIVIAAGYTNEMKLFMNSNPGLASRFVNVFHFEDYDPDQLLTITEGMAKASGYIFDENCSEVLKKKFTDLYGNRDKSFGNARTAKNILMEIITNQEERISNILNPTVEDLQTLIGKDARF